jgi:hypothetical protein
MIKKGIVPGDEKSEHKAKFGGEIPGFSPYFIENEIKVTFINHTFATRSEFLYPLMLSRRDVSV